LKPTRDLISDILFTFILRDNVSLDSKLILRLELICQTPVLLVNRAGIVSVLRLRLTVVG